MIRDDRELDRRLSALTRRAEPDEAVWRRIDSRIRRPSRHRPVLAGAAALVALAVLAGAWLLERPDAQPTPMRTLVAQEAAALRALAPARALPADFELPAPVEQAWDENQTAIAELEAALERDPDNRLLLEFLAQARLREAELMRAMLFPQRQRSL